DFSSAQLTSPPSGPLADGAAQNLVLDPFLFCNGSPPSGGAAGTGNAWPERGQVLSGPGGVTYLKVLAPFSATGFALSLADGAVVGGGTSPSGLAVTAPAASYNGPLNLTYTSDGAASTRTIATLVSGRVVNPRPPSGVFDLAAIVDVSGSMSGADPTFRRKDAVQLLIDLAGQGDRLVGTGFDDQFVDIFGRRTVAGTATKNALKRLARTRIVNRGGTDYDVGFANAFTALSADPLNPETPKGAIFLTDGAHNGTYDNTHLRFAFNGTGRAWRVCVVQLGRGFAPGDTARLKRIAAETGGIFRAAPDNTELESLYFQCRGRTSGATTLLRKVSTFRVGQSRVFSRKVPKGQRKATFFVGWGVGKYRLVLTQPGGRTFAKSAKRVRLVRGRAFSFFEVQSPKTGRWRLRVTRLATGGATDKATTTVTTQRRR
ncbi:MAG TPA: vWA domain-containing protein, partial [Miltoncostaeaceae bacterium]|nr:vWA domain-containing protein [Miltoncostaeaceae bacterium]